MFDQFAWAIGMFTQTAFVVLTVAYVLRNKFQLKSLVFEHRELEQIGRVKRVLLPALVLLLVYLFELQWLWLAYGDIDSSALDWSVVVILLGVLIIGPEAGLLAGVMATIIRAVIMLSNNADLLIVEAFEKTPLLRFDPRLWLEESWIFFEPGVAILPASALLSCFVFWYWRIRQRRDYPVWIGLPLALGVQLTFVVFATLQWGREAAAVYLRGESLPAGFGLALAVTALVIVSRASRLEYERRQTQQAELESARHQLQFLNAQINPHFLNNALSAIGGLMIKSPEKAQALLGNLGDYFRDICEQHQSLVTMESDLQVMNRYVEIEKARLAERLQVNVNVDADCLNVTLPRLTLQPLVENAIQHGVAPRSSGGLVTISAARRNGVLEVLVTDDGNGFMKNPTVDTFGVGLSNIHARLKHHYGNAMKLEINSAWGVGTTVRVEIPVEHTDEIEP
ncbi:MAG: histidine kinase [Granulosicoccus sp.]